jgi:hypothetical protein
LQGNLFEQRDTERLKLLMAIAQPEPTIRCQDGAICFSRADERLGDAAGDTIAQANDGLGGAFGGEGLRVACFRWF